MVINGTEIARKRKLELKNNLGSERREVVVIKTDSNKATESFIAIKEKVAQELDIIFTEIELKQSSTTEKIVHTIEEISERLTKNDGLVVQLPLSEHVDTDEVLSHIPPFLDIDMLNPETMKLFKQKETGMYPPVAEAVKIILEEENVNLINKEILVIGQGRLVGLPIITWLKREGLSPNAIDIDTDKATKKELIKKADIIFTGVGVPSLITKDMIKDGVILIDAGTSEQNGKLRGDVNPQCEEKASLITKTPGGVGPITVIALYSNLIKK